MITFGNIYIITSDFEKSVCFYKKLFEKDVDAQNKTRYAQFHLQGFTLALMNGRFDAEHPEEVIEKKEYSEIYDDTNRIMNSANCGKVVINLCTDNLQNEYQRIQKLGLGTDLTEIRYVNANMPYWYFLLKDPDGNTIEIAGEYKKGARCMDTNETIHNSGELEFAVFCVENVAEKLGVSAEEVYKAFTDKSDILNGYIVPEYEVLHTQSKEYIVNDIIELMQERGVTV